MNLSKIIIPTIHAAADIIGDIQAPTGLPAETTSTTTLIRSVLIFFIAVAGIFALVQFILGGIGFISSAGDKAKIEQAQQKITYAVIGLVTIAASFIITAIISKLLFGEFNAILAPKFESIL